MPFLPAVVTAPYLGAYRIRLRFSDGTEGAVSFRRWLKGPIRIDASATFVGLERVVGHVAGKAGSFVLQRTGVFENGAAKETYLVIPGSGTGELQGLRGEGTSAVGHGTEHLTLNYEFEGQ